MKKVKIELELNAIELNALLTGIESKWHGEWSRTRDIRGLTAAVESAAAGFEMCHPQDFEFETVNTVGVYVQLLRVLEHFPELKRDHASTWDADSAAQFHRAAARARKQLAAINNAELAGVAS